jgi:hypothetical protein
VELSLNSYLGLTLLARRVTHLDGVAWQGRRSHNNKKGSYNCNLRFNRSMCRASLRSPLSFWSRKWPTLYTTQILRLRAQSRVRPKGFNRRG